MASKKLTGVVTRKQLRELIESEPADARLAEMVREPVMAHPDEPLRVVVMRMAETGLTRMPVVEASSGSWWGWSRCRICCCARVRNLQEERDRERVLEIRLSIFWTANTGTKTSRPITSCSINNESVCSVAPAESVAISAPISASRQIATCRTALTNLPADGWFVGTRQRCARPSAPRRDSYVFGFPRFLRIESPRISMR